MTAFIHHLLQENSAKVVSEQQLIWNTTPPFFSAQHGIISQEIPLWPISVRQGGRFFTHPHHTHWREWGRVGKRDSNNTVQALLVNGQNIGGVNCFSHKPKPHHGGCYVERVLYPSHSQYILCCLPSPGILLSSNGQ